jgi:hypothetical protein
MNTAVKKIIAREFLYFLLVILIGSVTYAGIFTRNKYYIKKISIQKLRINKLSKNSVDRFDRWLSLEVASQNWYRDKPDREKEWKKLQIYFEDQNTRETTRLKWSNELLKFIKSIGFSSPDKLKTYTKTFVTPKEEIGALEESSNLEKQVKNLESKIIFEDEHNYITQLFSIIAFCSLFLTRYLYISIRWSINILTQAN